MRVTCIASLLLLLGGLGFGQTHPLSATDASAIRSVIEAYRTAWLANDDGANVRKLFTDDAVLIPHHGVAPVVGIKAIQDFWWPPNSPETRITRFVTTVDDVTGSGDIAYVRGRSDVAWTVNDGKTLASWQNSGNYLTVLRKTAGQWRITLQMWNDPPNQKVGIIAREGG